MAQISTYNRDLFISRNDILIGSDANDANITKNYSVGSIIDFVTAEVSGAVDKNFYLSNITADSGTGVITFSVTDSTDQVLTLGTAAFSAVGDFATADHAHAFGDIVTANSIGATQLNVSGNGLNGQVLISNGDGSFSWANDETIADTNYYLDDITINGNDLIFSVNGASSQTVTLGSAAFQSVTDIINTAKSSITLDDINSDSLGALATLNEVSSSYIQSDAITSLKIKDNAITEPKIKATNSPTAGYVLTSDGADGFTWAFNSASNYYVDSVTRSNETLTFNLAGGFSGTSPAYTFGQAAFKNVGTGATNVAAGNHTHVLSSITDSGTLAGLDTVDTGEIEDQAITTAKLSATGGTAGQVLALNSSLELDWIAGQSGASNFTALDDTPSSYGTAGQMLKINGTADGLVFADFKVSNANHFTTVNVGTAGKVLALNANNDGSTSYKALEWIDAGSVGATTFTGLQDTPSNIGTAYQLLSVNAAGSDLEFTTLTDGHIPNGLITGGDPTLDSMIAANTITAVNIANNTITNAQINAATITQTEMANNSVGTDQLINNSVTNAKLDINSVQTDQIANGQVTTDKIANANVTLEKLASDVTLTDLSSGDSTRTDWDVASDTKIDWYVNSNNQMRLFASGDLHVEGDVIAYSGQVASDKTLKTNITTIENPIDKVKQLDGVTFNWLKNGKASAGVIAQDVQKVLPEIVSEVKSLDDTSSHLAVDYNGIVGLLIETVKEQQNQIDELKALVKA